MYGLPLASIPKAYTNRNNTHHNINLALTIVYWYLYEYNLNHDGSTLRPIWKQRFKNKNGSSHHCDGGGEKVLGFDLGLCLGSLVGRLEVLGLDLAATQPPDPKGITCRAPNHLAM
jgi:hypothetical protein